LSTWHVWLPANQRPITSWARIFMGGPIRNCCISALFRRVIGPIVFAPCNYLRENPRKDLVLASYLLVTFSLRAITVNRRTAIFLTSGDLLFAFRVTFDVSPFTRRETRKSTYVTLHLLYVSPRCNEATRNGSIRGQSRNQRQVINISR